MFKVGSIVLVMSLLLSPLALADQQPDHPSAGLLNQCANYIKMTDSEFKKKGSSILDTIDQCLHFNVCGYPQLSSIDHCAMILAQRNFLVHNSKNSEEKAEDMPHALGKLTPAMGKLNPAIGKLNPAMGNLDPARGKLNPAIGNIKKPKSTNNAKTDEHNDIEWF